MCQKRSRKQFSSLWGYFEARASLFKCGECPTKPFSPPWMSFEARIGLFMCRERSVLTTVELL